MTRRTRTAAALLLAAAAAASTGLAGCKAGTPAPTASASQTTPTTPTTQTTRSDEAITRTVHISADGRVLSTYGDSGGCIVSVVLQAEEAPTSVTLTIVRTFRQQPGESCPMFRKIVLVKVALGAPLAGRELIDGSDGRRLPDPTNVPLGSAGTFSSAPAG